MYWTHLLWTLNCNSLVDKCMPVTAASVCLLPNIAGQQAVPKPAMSEGHRCMLQYPDMLHLGSVHNMSRLSQYAE